MAAAAAAAGTNDVSFAQAKLISSPSTGGAGGTCDASVDGGPDVGERLSADQDTFCMTPPLSIVSVDMNGDGTVKELRQGTLALFTGERRVWTEAVWTGATCAHIFVPSGTHLDAALGKVAHLVAGKRQDGKILLAPLGVVAKVSADMDLAWVRLYPGVMESLTNLKGQNKDKPATKTVPAAAVQDNAEIHTPAQRPPAAPAAGAGAACADAQNKTSTPNPLAPACAELAAASASIGPASVCCRRCPSTNSDCPARLLACTD
jgi:hypothetical protein